MAAAPLSAGTATLTWTPPTENTDGSPLTDLAGFKVYWGCAQSGTYTSSVQLDDPDLTTYIVEDLPDGGTCYFVATAFNAEGLESAFSNQASKMLGPGTVPQPPTNLATDPDEPTPVFTFLVTLDRVALVEVGSVGPGTPCNGAYSVNGHYLVPKGSVSFLGSVQPEAVFAACSPG